MNTGSNGFRPKPRKTKIPTGRVLQPSLVPVCDVEIPSAVEAYLASLSALDIDQRVAVINALKRRLHAVSPFASEPVDLVLWVKADTVIANDYNPNTVAPPEMRLLEHSIQEDGYTQPIVAWERAGIHEVVDGFHRHRVGRESAAVSARVHGYLPVSIINEDRLDRGDRIAATIRHNRARGKHRVDSMSDIVVELKRRNWTDEKVARELGMDPDEVLRLTQITGLAELFANQDFSRAWDMGDDTDVTEDIAGLTLEDTADDDA